MDYDKEVINFLSKKENISTVWDIYDYFKRVNEKIHMDFWISVTKSLKIKLQPYAHIWRMDFQPDKCLEQYGGLVLRPVSETQKNSLRFGLDQETRAGSLQLYISIHCNRGADMTQVIENEILQDLMKKFKEAGFEISKPASGFWKWVDYRPQTRDFCVRIANNIDAVTLDVVNQFWHVFEDHREQFETLNEALGRIEGV